MGLFVMCVIKHHSPDVHMHNNNQGGVRLRLKSETALRGKRNIILPSTGRSAAYKRAFQWRASTGSPLSGLTSA